MADSSNSINGEARRFRLASIRDKVRSILSNTRQRRILWFVGAALLWAVLFFAVHLLQQKFFHVGIIWADDFNIYNSMLKHGFWYVVYHSARPVSVAFLLLGFKLFGPNTALLGWYWAAFFALALVCIYALFAYTTRNFWIPLFFLLAALLSRLNWYYYIVAWGVMESLALAFTCLSLLFLVRWYRDRKWPSFAISLVFAGLTLLCHERYLAIPIMLAIIGTIFGKGWKQKMTFGVVGAFIPLAFFLFKTVILGQPFWVVTGKTDISLDLGTLIGNFWRIFVNCFCLDESQHWFTGMSTEMLTGSGALMMKLSIFIAVICFAFVIYDIVLSLLEKRWRHTLVYLFIALFYIAIAAGGSTSPERVEPRWIYVPQIMVFLFWALALSSFHLPARTNLQFSLTGEKVVVHAARIGFTALAFLAISVSSMYVVNNRYRYYIDDWYAESQTYYDAIIKPYQESGKDALCVLTTSDCEKLVDQILKLYPPKEIYLIVNGVGEQPPKEKWDDCHFCVWNPLSSQSELYFDQTYMVKDEWMEESLSFYMQSSSPFLALTLTGIDNPTGNINGITVKVNGQFKYHELIQGKRQVAIPFEPGAFSYVEIIPDFTWCPKEYGAGDDARNLSFCINKFGHTDIEDIHFVQDWTDPIWAATVLSQEYAGLTIEMPSLQPQAVKDYGVSIYVNKSLLVHEDLSQNSLSRIIPLQPNVASLIEIIPDEILNPKKAGTGEDSRDLGVLIDAMHKASNKLESFASDWTTPNYTATLFNTKYSQISVTISGEVYPYAHPNGASFFVNEECVLQTEIPEGCTEYLIDIPLNAPVVFTIVSSYSFVPKEMGMGDDIRSLGLYITDFHPIEAQLN